MNTKDVIRLVSKKAGIPETETKKFFEIFLKQTSNILKPGESIKIPGVGLFQLRVGQIENPSGTAEQQFIYSNLIVFIEENDQNERAEEVIFNVPTDFEEEYHPVDSYFSLSIGKPIVPLKGVKAAEYFIPPSGSELRGLIESKITRLLEEAEKTEGGKETEIILLESKKPSFNLEQAEEELPVQSDFLKTREFENLSWDFGENLSQSIEEEISGKIIEEPVEKEDIVPENINKFPLKDIDETPHFEEEIVSEQHNEEIFEDVLEEGTEWMESDEETRDELKDSDFEDMVVEETKDFKAPEILTEEKETEEKTRPDKEELSLKNFQRVSRLTKEFNTSVDEGSEAAEDEKTPPKVTEVRGGFQKVRRTTAEFNFDLSGVKGLDEEESASETKDKVRSGSYEGYRKKSIIPSLIMAAVVIIALAGIIFLYLRLKSNNSITGADNTRTTKPQTKIIERNYDVPVTYPYNSTNESKTADLSGNTAGSSKDENTQKNNNTPGGESNSDQIEIRQPINAERIENYIYQYPEGIVVQVSSWKSKSIALSEVKKYRSAGFTAFAEMSAIPGMGLYYRVRVGYFTSLDKAKEFVTGNQ